MVSIGVHCMPSLSYSLPERKKNDRGKEELYEDSLHSTNRAQQGEQIKFMIKTRTIVALPTIFSMWKVSVKGASDLAKRYGTSTKGQANVLPLPHVAASQNGKWRRGFA
jgi:hypothetical protein